MIKRNTGYNQKIQKWQICFLGGGQKEKSKVRFLCIFENWTPSLSVMKAIDLKAVICTKVSVQICLQIKDTCDESSESNVFCASSGQILDVSASSQRHKKID